jgi:hypothetical protein
MQRSTWLLTICSLGIAAAVAACAGPTATSSIPSGGHVAPGRQYEVWVQSTGPAASSLFTVIDPSAGNVLRTIPAGVPTSDAREVYRAVPDGAGTRVSAVDPDTGNVSAALHLPYSVVLPTMDGGNVAPLTPHGQVLVLSHQARDSAGTVRESSFAVIERNLAGARPLIRLPGSWRYDGVSADGSNLFLIQDLTATPSKSYYVRRYDVAANRLDPNVIVAKGDTETKMTGVGVARAFLAGGIWQLTLYADGPSGAFIHALNLTQPNLAICLDISGSPVSGHEGYWSIVTAQDGTAVAVNGATGNIATVRLNGIPGIGLTARDRVPTSLLKGDGVAGSCCVPVNGAAVLGPEGRTVYAAAPSGVAVYDTTTLTLTGSVATGMRPQSLAGLPDGRLVVADSRGPVMLLDVVAGAPPELLWHGGPAGAVTVVEVAPR